MKNAQNNTSTAGLAAHAQGASTVDAARSLAARAFLADPYIATAARP
jgi:hypothetical protein